MALWQHFREQISKEDLHFEDEVGIEMLGTATGATAEAERGPPDALASADTTCCSQRKNSVFRHQHMRLVQKSFDFVGSNLQV
jgi:hypothetical protein